MEHKLLEERSAEATVGKQTDAAGEGKLCIRLWLQASQTRASGAPLTQRKTHRGGTPIWLSFLPGSSCLSQHIFVICCVFCQYFLHFNTIFSSYFWAKLYFKMKGILKLHMHHMMCGESKILNLVFFVSVYDRWKCWIYVCSRRLRRRLCFRQISMYRGRRSATCTPRRNSSNRNSTICWSSNSAWRNKIKNYAGELGFMMDDIYIYIYILQWYCSSVLLSL